MPHIIIVLNSSVYSISFPGEILGKQGVPVFPQKDTDNMEFFSLRCVNILTAPTFCSFEMCVLHNRKKHTTRTLKTYFLMPTVTSMKTTCLVQWDISQLLKKNEKMLFAATLMDLEIVIPSEVSQTEKEKYHMTSLICRI